MIVVLLASLLIPPPDPLPAIGVASLARDAACAIIEGPALEPGRELTIVLPRLPQQVIEATVVSRMDACRSPENGSLADAHEPGSPPMLSYAVSLSAPMPEVPEIGVVFAARFPVKQLTDAYELRVSDIYPRVRVRSCTSLEGVHLSVWSGTPLASRRLWRTYWYLGYDVEPTCENGETGP